VVAPKFYDSCASFLVFEIAIRCLDRSVSLVEMALEFNLDEQFPQLSKAPIVEAALQINTRSGAAWTEQRVSTELNKVFGNTAQMLPVQGSQLTLKGNPLTGIKDTAFVASWLGTRVSLPERSEVISFTRDFFSFSRLYPYERWELFLERAMSLLELHIRIAQPATAQRVGLRFVNRIEMSGGLRLEEYLTSPPQDPSGLDLPIGSFLYQANFETPGYPYSIRVSRTLQQTIRPLRNPPALLLDLDVSINKPIQVDRVLIQEHLRRMRWLKNKMFFGTITKELKEKLL
jgi:uncharacterized protein (TIGR04255 family)